MPCSVVTGKQGSTSTTIHNRAYTEVRKDSAMKSKIETLLMRALIMSLVLNAVLTIVFLTIWLMLKSVE